MFWGSIWSDLDAMLHDFGGPGGILGILGRPLAKRGAQEEAKTQPRWPKMRSKRPTSANMEAKMAL